MPHTRSRHALQSLQKKLNYSRIVSIQGPRQCGKSFLAREILPETLTGYAYITLDLKQNREFAQKNPGTFLKQNDTQGTLAIDEAQKAPDLFDELKATVDLDPRPGQYLILGSTEFSREVQIRESLTGRLSRQRLFPLNLGEILQLPFEKSPGSHHFRKKPRATRKEFLQFLKNGGLPGIFAVRSEHEQTLKFQEWVEVTVYRDLLQFPKLKPDPELALEILRLVATLEFPDSTRIRDALKKDLRTVKLHLNLLEQLFVLTRTRTHLLSTGKDLYTLCDPGIARFLGASFECLLQTATLLELQSQAAYDGRSGVHWRLSTWRSSKGARVDWIIETDKEVLLIKILSEESLDPRDFRGVLAAQEKISKENPEKPVRIVVLSSTERALQIEGVDVLPWESVG